MPTADQFQKYALQQGNGIYRLESKFKENLNIIMDLAARACLGKDSEGTISDRQMLSLTLCFRKGNSDCVFEAKLTFPFYLLSPIDLNYWRVYMV